MSAIVLGEKLKSISDLGELAEFVNGLISDGKHPGTPISLDGEYSEFRGGEVSVRINLNEGNPEEEILDFSRGLKFRE